MQLLQARFFHPSHLHNCSQPVNMYLIFSKIELFQAEMANKSKDGWHWLSQRERAPYIRQNNLEEVREKC